MEKIVIPESNYRIRKARIVRIKLLTPLEKLFEIELDGGRSLDHEPGQFIMVSLFGVGEAPISVASSPTSRTTFEICVRAVGKVTTALHALDAGDEIGIRGPYGRGFPLRIFEGNDLLIVAGGLGIAPLRSLIQYVLDNRRDFGKAHLILGSKTPRDILFADELDQWRRRMDVQSECIVDRAEQDWTGPVGLLTTLIPGVHLEPERTFGVVVGPPVMYKFVLKELLAKKIPEHQIILSFERHMKCGMGKCGRCQIQDLYTCQDGPAFRYSAVKHMSEAF